MLKAAAEPTRLRLLAVCAEGELTVGELCVVLHQSQPRVSRHLKLLCDAGLLLRFREEHWVYYRTHIEEAGGEVARQLLAWTDSQDPAVLRDRARAAQVRSERAKLAAEQMQTAGDAGNRIDSSVDDSLRGVLLGELGQMAIGDLLDIGTGTGRILNWLAPQAQRAVGIDLSIDALRIARTAVHSAGLSHCLLQRGDMYLLPFGGDSFDTIIMDRVLAEAERPGVALQEAVRLLRPGGRLVVIEDYDRLEHAGAARQSNALATLRAWLRSAGLHCERLRPVETSAQHLLLAVGRPRRDGLEAAA